MLRLDDVLRDVVLPKAVAVPQTVNLLAVSRSLPNLAVRQFTLTNVSVQTSSHLAAIPAVHQLHAVLQNAELAAAEPLVVKLLVAEHDAYVTIAVTQTAVTLQTHAVTMPTDAAMMETHAAIQDAAKLVEFALVVAAPLVANNHELVVADETTAAAMLHNHAVTSTHLAVLHEYALAVAADAVTTTAAVTSTTAVTMETLAAQQTIAVSILANLLS